MPESKQVLKRNTMVGHVKGHRAHQEKKMAQRAEHFKAPEIIPLSSGQIANLSDAQFKTLVIRTLTELVEFGRKLDEKMRAMLRETKENVQGTNSDELISMTHGHEL